MLPDRRAHEVQQALMESRASLGRQEHGAQQVLTALRVLPERQDRLGRKDQLAQQLLVRKASKAFKASRALPDLRAQLVPRASPEPLDPRAREVRQVLMA